MRAIQHRAKVKNESDPQNGQWVKGYFVKTYLGGGKESARIYTGQADRGTGGPEWHEVDPETVGRYTGLNDKKTGNMIFEDDLVMVRARGAAYFGKVEYIKGLLYANDGKFQHFGFWEDDTRIIGNIYDNPELWEALK